MYFILSTMFYSWPTTMFSPTRTYSKKLKKEGQGDAVRKRM